MAFTYPQAALDWMLDGIGSSLLVLADSLALPRVLARRGCLVVAVHRDWRRLRTAIGAQGISLAGARAEALPFGDCRFDGILVHQVFADVAPGLALPEFARVLRPQGRLMVSQLGRDNSVPWVRRLVQLIHTVDPNAMTAPPAADTLVPVLQSKYFHGSAREFRHWEPITRQGMIDMVGANPAARRLDVGSRRRLLDAVAALHSEAAGNNQLRLPYQLACWRGQVDHDELTRPVHLDESGLIIHV